MLTLETLAELADRHRDALKATVREFTIGGELFRWNSEPALMGVINLSADSWYRESVCLSTEAAVQRGAVLHAQGARIIDIGAESTLAHAARADDALQRSMLLPVVRELRARKILVSVETYSTAVARACLEAGANVLNLTGTANTEEMFRLAAAHEAAVILCYVEGEHVRAVGDFDLSSDPIPRMSDYFARQLDLAAKASQTGARDHRSGHGLLLPEPAGQQRARAAPDECFPEYIPPAHPRRARVPRLAPRIRVFP
jgi:dihydropteroate synthase